MFPSLCPSKVIAEEKWIRRVPSLSKRLTIKVAPFGEKVSNRASGTFRPHIRASSCTVISHAPLFVSSCLEGNFAIHKEPSTSWTVALGRAPPREEPGASSCFSHCSSKPDSSFSKAMDADSSLRKETHGGVASDSSEDSNELPSPRLKRKAPILAASYTPRR